MLKTAKEINDNIKSRSERERKELVTWVTRLIEEASEKMFRNYNTAWRLDVKPEHIADFECAIREKEIIELLETAEFEISGNQNGFYLKTKV